MATTFTGTLSIGLVGSYAKASDLLSLPGAIGYAIASSYTNGTGANQANAFWSDTRTLAATAESFDLKTAGGTVIVDDYGVTLPFTLIKLLIVRNKSAVSGQTLTLSGNFLSSMDGGTGPTHIIGAGGTFVADCPIEGYTVSNTTRDTLTLTNSATFDYDILICGIV